MSLSGTLLLLVVEWEQPKQSITSTRTDQSLHQLVPNGVKTGEMVPKNLQLDKSGGISSLYLLPLKVEQLHPLEYI